MDCGIACLAMVLSYHGRRTKLDELRQVVGRGRSGSTARDLLHAARKLGLDGQGVQVENDQVGYLEPGAILHWKGVHFVVFERLRGNRVDIIDPASGPETLSLDEFNRAFTHVALLLEPTEAFVPGGGQTDSQSWAWIVRHVKRSRWGRILATTALLQMVGLAVPILTGSVIDRVLPRGDYRLLVVLLAGFACVLAGQFVASIVRAHLLTEVRARFDMALPFTFIRHLMGLPLAYFQSRHTGDLLARYNTIGEVRQFLTQGALSSLLDGALALLYFIILFALSPLLALTTLVVGALMGVVFWASRAPLRQYARRELEATSRSHEGLSEMLTAVNDLKSMGAEEASLDEWVPRRLTYAEVMTARSKFEAWIDAIKGTLQTAAPLILLGFGAQQVLSGQVSLGTMLGLWALASALLTPLANLINTASTFQAIASACERLDDVFDSEVEQPPGRPRREIELDGSIDLKGVSFRYAPDTPLVLQDVDLHIEPGKMVAVVGRSGSGKSTLSMLLLGLYRPSSGSISFNGVELQELELRALRQQMGIVLQQPHIFSGSIRENVLKTAPGATDEEVHEAIRVACLAEDIGALPTGLDTILPQGGTTLSGGQRQRLAIARALARKPKILVLDEATSALDAITEHQVQQALARLQCTRVVIAHRLSTVAHADVILVMQDGRIAEKGRHHELLALNGAYAQLVQMQLDGGGDAA